MRIISVVGLKNAGKTTLIVALAREFHRRGKRLATIKQTVHPVDVGSQGSDSWRYLHEGLADGVLIAGSEVRLVLERQSKNMDPLSLAQHYFADRDLVIVEGLESAPIPKIEIYRKSLGGSPLIHAATDKSPWVALLSDTELTGVTCPVLRFTDTMWLQLLASLAWDRAQPVTS